MSQRSTTGETSGVELKKSLRSGTVWAKEHAAFLLVLLLGVVLRVFLNNVARYSKADEGHYVAATQLLVEGGLRAYPQLVTHYLTHPDEWLYPTPLRYGYLALTSLTCAVRAPCDARALAWLSTVAGGVSIIWTYLLGLRLLGRRPALLAAALAVTSPLQLALGRRALQDEVYCAAFLAALYSLVRLLQILQKESDQRGSQASKQTFSKLHALLFVLSCTFAFAIKEAFVFPYVGFVALFVLARKPARFGVFDGILLALPPLVFAALFAILSGAPIAFFELLEKTQASFLSDYSVQFQSGPPHRPLYDLFVLSPLVCLGAAFTIPLVLLGFDPRAPSEGQAPRAERDGHKWLLPVLIFSLAAFAGLPKNLRFTIILDPLFRLLAAFSFASIVQKRSLRTSVVWLCGVALLNAVVEGTLFRDAFLSHPTYDPTTHDILRALGSLPRPAEKVEPNGWPQLFFAASALAILALHLTRRSIVTQNENETEDPNVAEGSKENEPLEAEPKVSANRERVVTISIALACVIVALFVGRSCGMDGVSGQAASTATSSSGGTPDEQAAAAVSAGLAAATPQEAISHFQKALETYPGHYGATFQLARALDRAGRTDEATKQWQRVLSLAERSGDQPLVETASARLGQAAQAPAGDPMTVGLDALYKKRDPNLAVLRFREVLASAPDHYGATFQLATALEQTGDLRGARPVWDKMLKLAEASSDAPTIETARTHIAELDRKLGPPPAEDASSAAMREGLEALYTRKDAAAAVPLFQKVLATTPDHYGATFQLATALDQLKKGAQAKPLWEKMLKMAEATSDPKTADIARARLAQKP